MIKESIRAQKFLLFHGAAVLCVVAGWLIFYWISNPLGFFDPPKFDFIKEKKLSGMADEYLTKPAQIYFHRPEVLLLGNSMAGMGFARSHFPAETNVVNGAIFGSKPGTWLRLLQNAKEVNQDLDVVYLVLDLTVINATFYKEELVRMEQFENHLLVDNKNRFNISAPFNFVSDLLSLIISIDGLDALRKFYKQEHADGRYMDSDGFQYYQMRHDNIEIRQAYRISDRKKLFDVEFENASEYESLKELLEFSYKNGIELKIILPPYHVSVYQALSQKGKLENFVEWKRSLFELNEQIFYEHQSKQNDAMKIKSSYAIFDFSRYSDLTRDQYLLSGEKIKGSLYYHDLNHFNHDAGDLILQDVSNPDDLRNSRVLTEDELNSMLADMQNNSDMFSMQHQ